MKIGIIVAMDKEMKQLTSLIENPQTEQHGTMVFTVGTIAANEVIVQKSGIGKVNAAVGTVEMIAAYRPDVIVSSGCAGGADTSLERGDVVVGSSYCYHDAYCGSEESIGLMEGLTATFSADKALLDKALAMDCGVNIRGGLIAGGDWFVDTPEKMTAILTRCPEAMAVDMESCAIAQVCNIYKVRFISFRVVSDIPLKPDHASQYADFWTRMADTSFAVTRRFIETF